MNSKRFISVVRWLGAALGLAGIVAFYKLAVHANQTTVAITFLLLILFLAARWGLRYAVVTSFAAGACYNFFFLPPIGKFTVSDPQNLVALLAFLTTSVVASRLSQGMRSESEHARARQAELEVLYSLSRGLLQTDDPARLANTIAAIVMSATGSKSVLFYLLDGDRIYLSGIDWPSATTSAELQEIAHAPGVSVRTAGAGLIPLRTGVRPIGAIILRGITLSAQTLEAIGGLVAVSLSRARAMESITNEEVAKEGERLRTLILDEVTQDLQLPLTAITASVESLRTSSLSDELRTSFHDIIEEEAGRLSQVVADTVELARLDTQQASMTLSPHDLRELVKLAVDAVAAPVEGREIVVRLPARLPQVMVDPARIQKVIGHLLQNAAKYSDASNPITISAEVEGSFVCCSVADRGIGIDDAEQALIFDRLYRAKNGLKSHSGFGMGLAICRAIVEAHGGRLSVSSQLGQGSVFTFSVPSI